VTPGELEVLDEWLDGVSAEGEQGPLASP
jgi:hypothetical protein